MPETYLEQPKTADPFERRLSALMEVAGIDALQDLPGFCGELTARVASLVKATKVEFSVVEGSLLRAQPRTYGFGPEILELSVPCTPDGDGFADRIVYQGMIFRGSITDDPSFNPYRQVLEVMQVSNAIAVGVQAGNHPIGLLAAFDSERTGGFTDEDVRLLRITATGAGLLWREKQLSDERAHLHSEAQSLNEAMRLMVNAMVHELRAPLTVARGYLDIVLEAGFGAVPITLLEPLQTVGRKLGEATTLVEDLLLSSRLESGAIESNPEEVDLGQVAASVAEREVSRAHLAGGKVTVDKFAGPVLVTADPKHLGTILGNLVRNAISYSGGAPEVTIRVSSDPCPTVTVTDRGRGIPAEAQARLFERFFRVKDRSTPSGSGLGLYISRQLARREGGDVVLDWSEEGVGTAFALRFPPPAKAAANTAS